MHYQFYFNQKIIYWFNFYDNNLWCLGRNRSALVYLLKMEKCHESRSDQHFKNARWCCFRYHKFAYWAREKNLCWTPFGTQRFNDLFNNQSYWISHYNNRQFFRNESSSYCFYWSFPLYLVYFTQIYRSLSIIQICIGFKNDFRENLKVLSDCYQTKLYLLIENLLIRTDADLI